MKATILASGLSLIAISALNAQSLHTEDFTNGTGEFTALNNTTVNTTGGALEFVNTNNQGAGVTINLDQTGVFGDNFENVTLDGNGDISSPSIFFQFTTIVPANSTANDELGFFFGPQPNQAQSSDIFNGGNTNGFTLFFNDGGLFAQNGNGSQSSENSGSVNILSGLAAGSEVTIDVEWFLTPAQNNGQFNNAFIVDAVGTDGTSAVSASDQTFDGAQNQNVGQINSYQFTASTTQGLTGSIDDFAVSTAPIETVPEPSGVLLTGLGGLAMLIRRKRA